MRENSRIQMFEIKDGWLEDKTISSCKSSLIIAIYYLLDHRQHGSKYVLFPNRLAARSWQAEA